jgi:glutamyl-tRNA synthetase
MTDVPGAGRFAPSPSGDLHIGNLRTALLAWLWARSSRRSFFLRVEDLDRVHAGAETRQLDDLRALGLDWDEPVVRQSERLAAYADSLRLLTDAGLTYPCFCTRHEILDAPTAPHAPPGTYPGTCRNLTDAERARRSAERPAALRLRSDTAEWTVTDDLHGSFTGVVDDFVLQRNDGVPAYNLAVVVDDAAQGVDQIVRADDLLTSAPRQAYLAILLGHSAATYAHVPLAVNADGARLAKRDGAVTRADLEALGLDVFDLIVQSLGMTGSSPQDLLPRFEPGSLPAEPWVFVPPVT